jgi:hypothetical protein
MHACMCIQLYKKYNAMRRESNLSIPATRDLKTKQQAGIAPAATCARVVVAHQCKWGELSNGNNGVCAESARLFP